MVCTANCTIYLRVRIVLDYALPDINIGGLLSIEHHGYPSTGLGDKYP